MSLAWGWIGWIVFGGLAGWIASMIMKTNAQMGALANIVCGIVGGIVGGSILGYLTGKEQAGLFLSFLTAVVGACLVIWIYNFVRSKVGK